MSRYVQSSAILCISVALVFSVGRAACAQSIPELQAKITALAAQVHALRAQVDARTSPVLYTFTRDIVPGARGEDVRALQSFLIKKGYLKIDVPTTTFGFLTKAAVIAWQRSEGIPPVGGRVGAQSRAKLNSERAAVPGVQPAQVAGSAPSPRTVIVPAVVSGMSGISGGGTSSTPPPTVTSDTTPPIISAVASSTRLTSATITWTTDELSTSTVEYGTSTAYGLVTTSASLVTSHSLRMLSLTPGATYHFRVSSSDASGNRAVSADFVIAAATQPAADEITFQTSDTSFSPIITVGGGATVEWIFADGTVSASTTPTVNYGSAASRYNRLKVTPWSALSAINVGYDAGDSGTSTIALLSQQHVTAVFGLENASSSLQTWASSYNPLTALDFSNFSSLNTMECYFCSALASITLHSTPSLARLNVEGANLLNVDVSESPSLADLRAAVQRNTSFSITWGTTGAHVWHICTRDNTQMVPNFLPAMTQFPVLRELWIWNSNQSGTLHTASDQLTSIRVNNNRYTSADFTGAFPTGRSGELDISHNALTSLTMASNPGLAVLDARNNTLGPAAIDSVLQTIDGFSTTNGTIYLTNNSAPTATGTVYVNNLRARGWTVNVDAPDVTPPVISAVTAFASPTSATINWTTDELATSTVEYGTSTAYGLASTSASFVTAHSMVLNGLTADAVYHYRVLSTDISGNLASSTDHVFTAVSTSTVYWEDNFQRADGNPGNGWLGANNASGTIVSNVLRRTDAGSYAIYYNMASSTLPADYYTTITVSDAVAHRTYWGLIGRYVPDTFGTGLKVFWAGSPAPTSPGTGHAGFDSDIVATVTGGMPASWSVAQNHTLTLRFAGVTTTVYLDGQEYGYFTDSTNNQTGTGMGIVGDGGGATPFEILDIKATNYLPVP